MELDTKIVSSACPIAEVIFYAFFYELPDVIGKVLIYILKQYPIVGYEVNKLTLSG